MGGGKLHQALRALCFNTDWNYAMFWKLEHRARMMLTWEDTYYDKHEQDGPSMSNWFNDTLENLCDGHFIPDLLGLEVAKMSYHVYSLGEGFVGQVALTGRHMWISGDRHVTDSYSVYEQCDGWQAQFSNGIRTVAVVAVIPHGVLQLGSLNTVAEDLMLVKRIRDTFLRLHSLLVGHITSLQPCSIDCSPCLSDISTRSSNSGNCFITNTDRTLERKRESISTQILSSLGVPAEFSSRLELRGDCPRKKVMIKDHQGTECSMSGVCGSANLLSISEISHIERKTRADKNLITDKECLEEVSGLRDEDIGYELKASDRSSLDLLSNKASSLNDTVVTDNFEVDISYSLSTFDSAPWNDQNGLSCLPESSSVEMLNGSKKNLDFEKEINDPDVLKVSFKFPAGCELYEALGPAFRKQKSNYDMEKGKTQTETVVEMPVEMSSSNLLVTNSCSEHLLEAVIANVCQSDSEDKSLGSSSKPFSSLLPKGNVVELPSSGMPMGNLVEVPSSNMQTSGSTCYTSEQSFLVEEDTPCCFASVAYGVRSLKALSSARHSRHSEQLEKSQDPAMVTKKRARPGENCRPRPRDRQLIQDRIKELRELVPNGSKCSIDSLLERTIRHMLFMQSITKHADKIDKCAESKLLDKETAIQGSSLQEKGSSWIMEVGNDLKVCPIIVENINLNGQMLVEMLCEEGIHFLEIAEAIRSWGLTILKGVTEAYGDKTWMCFVVEPQYNRNMHRMDILWSLVQIMQSKTKT